MTVVCILPNKFELLFCKFWAECLKYPMLLVFRTICWHFVNWSMLSKAFLGRGVHLVSISCGYYISERGLKPGSPICKDPFLVLHKDKKFLRPLASFLPKMVSFFHLNQNIVLPSLCPAAKLISLHCLDVQYQFMTI